MSRDPGSVWAPLPEAGAPDGYVKTQFIVHSTGDNGTAQATARYFGGVTPNESTFIVGQGPHDPTLQIMDSTDRADANMSASIRAISVEVVGDGVGGYNAWQRAELIRLGRWARSVHGIPPRVIPTHTEPGFGWHVMFGAPGPWAGVAKVCPGRQRIKELQADIFPAIFAGTDSASVQEDDMFDTPDRADVKATRVTVDWALDPEGGFNSKGELTKRIRDIHGLVAGQGQAITALTTLVAKQNGLSLDDVERVVRQAIAKGIDVDVTVSPGTTATAG